LRSSWEGKAKINGLVVSVGRENNLINIALHHSDERDCPLHIPYSLPV
jgi:hypothetical protein